MKKSRWVDFGVVCGLFFLAFMFAVLRHDSQIKTMDQAGFALTMPITAMKTRIMLFITALGSPQFLGPITLVMMLIFMVEKTAWQQHVVWRNAVCGISAGNFL